VSGCIVWLKTLNLALMGGTSQHIIFISLLFIFVYFFCFPLLLLCFVFQGQVCLSSSLGGNTLSQTYSKQFVHLLGKILPCYTHIGDNVYFKFGAMGDTLHTLCL
jgi:hypothetical protein